MFRDIAELIWYKAGLDPEETISGWGTLEDAIEELKSRLPAIQVRIHACMLDGGDGTYDFALFKTKAGAEAREKNEEERMGYSCEDAVKQINVDVDHDGNILSQLDWVSVDEDWNNPVYEE